MWSLQFEFSAGRVLHTCRSGLTSNMFTLNTWARAAAAHMYSHTDTTGKQWAIFTHDANTEGNTSNTNDRYGRRQRQQRRRKHKTQNGSQACHATPRNTSANKKSHHLTNTTQGTVDRSLESWLDSIHLEPCSLCFHTEIELVRETSFNGENGILRFRLIFYRRHQPVEC